MRLILIILTLVLFNTTTQAALHLEPLVYYANGESIYKNSNQELKQDGILFGGRMGWYKNSFTVGLEYLTGDLTYEFDGSNAEFDETPHYMGAYLGYHLQKRFGLNLSYFLKARSNADIGKLSGDAWKVELYYRIKTHISFRVGYKHRTLDYNENSNSRLNDELESKTILVGLSFPWVL